MTVITNSREQEALVRSVAAVLQGSPHADTVIANLNQGDPLETAISGVNETDPLRKPLAVLLELLDLSEQSPTLFESDLANGGAPSLSKFASIHFPKLTDEAFRANLFFAAPTAVILSLVEADKIAVPDSLRSEIVAVLQIGAKNGFNMNIDPFRVLQDRMIGASDDALIFMKKLYRLQALVKEPEQINVLIAAGYGSAHSIAHTEYNKFTSDPKFKSLTKDALAGIYDYAVGIETSNEQTWVSLLRARGAMRVAAIDESPPPQSLSAPMKADAAVENSPFVFEEEKYRQDADGYKSDEKLEANFANMFSQTQSDDCPDCTSITSYAAYFVDLLQLLEDTKYHDMYQPEVERSLMENIRVRRPDLEYLELSCANTNNVLQYIDLANEIMESSVAFIGRLDERIVVPYNESAQETCATGSLGRKLPANTNYEIYQKFISNQVFPMNVFPWNQATASINLSCECLGVPRPDAVGGAPLLWRLVKLVKRTPGISAEEAKSISEEALTRAKAAACLNLQEQDYVVITHEGFCPRAATTLSAREYREQIGLKIPGEYWGYIDNVAMISESPDSYRRISGLQDVLRQFLPRSNLTFPELLALLKTRYLSRRLTLQSSSADPRAFSGRIEDMRLRTPVPDSSGSTLNVSICDDVQRFIRLWKRIAWGLDELDDALICLAPGVDECHVSGITPAMVNELAAIKQLTELLGTNVSTLLPLWGDISQEVFRRKFESSGFDVFAPDKDGRYFRTPRKISDHIHAVSICLNIRTEDFVSVEALGLSDNLNMETISRLRRLSVLSRLLGVLPRDLPFILDIFSSSSLNPLSAKSPSGTLKFISQWRTLGDSGFNAAKISSVLGDSDSFTPRGRALKACTAILRGFDQLETLKSLQATPSEQAGKMQHGIVRQLILDVINADFASTDAAIVHHLLLDVIPAGMMVLEKLNYFDATETMAPEFCGYFVPPTTETFRFAFSAPAGVTPPILSVDNVALELNIADGETSFTSPEQRFTKGQVYRLSFSGNLRGLSWITATASEPVSFGKKSLIDDAAINSVGLIYGTLERATEVIATLRLTLDELRFASLQLRKGAKNEFAIKFGQITFQNLTFLQNYVAVRDSCKKPLPTGKTLLDLYKWTASPSERDPKPWEDATATNKPRATAKVGADTSEVAARIAESTGWPLGQISDILAEGYPDLSQNDLTSLIREGKLLFELKAAMELLKKVQVPSITTKVLCNLVEPRLPDGKQTEKEFAGAAQLRLLLHQSQKNSESNAISRVGSVHDKIRVAQRTALVYYLLQQPFYVNKQVADPDALFEYLLVDVQMGACLESSRMKNAISTIQLFVHRCLQGLEKNHGIPPIAISKRWEYTRSYPLWEANRRVFLYPENYIEPTLRDNKTDVFKNLEAAIMQRDISMQNVDDSIKAYVHAAHDMGDLEILTYLWNRGDDDNGVFHFFARTRMAPYTYYHRTLEVKTLIGGMVPYFFWTPWGVLAIDIPVMEVDCDGRSVSVPGVYLIPALHEDRLYLFIPHLTLKTAPPVLPANTSLRQVAEETDRQKALTLESFWELRMAWSEFRKGVWSPKQISQSALEIRKQTAPTFKVAPDPTDLAGKLSPLSLPLPSVDSFRFSLRQRGEDVLIIDAYKLVRDTISWPEKPDSLSGWKMHLGAFELRGQQLVKVENPVGETSVTHQDWMKALTRSPVTSFMKLRYMREKELAPKDIKDGEVGVRLGLVEKADELTGVRDTTPVKALSWTMSFDYIRNQQPYGHVLEVDSGDRFQTYFALVDEKKDTKTRIYDILKHTLSPELMRAAARGGVQDIFEVFKTNRDPDVRLDLYGRRNGPIYHEQSTPYSQYNWELGVHSVMLLMERLLALQQFDLALQVAHFVFDPRAKGTSVNNCWVFEPFRDRSLRLQQSFEMMVEDLQSSSKRASNGRLRLMGMEWKANPFNPHAVARMSPVSYMKRILMKYVEILIASGDYYFRQNSLESLPLAIQQYVQASHIFGPTAQKVPKLGKTIARSYRDIQRTADNLKRFRRSDEGLSNAAVELDLEFPFFSPPRTRGSRRMRPDDTTSLFGFLATSYFCVPANPQFTILRTTIDDRLFKLRNCLDINGNPRRLSLFEPKIDPMALVQAAAAGRLSASIMLNDAESPMPNYRFVYLLGKALELCTEMKNLQALFLSAKEKSNAEELAVLKLKQEVVINGLVHDMKIKTREEALKSIDALIETRKTHEHRLAFYLKVIGEKADKIPGDTKEWTDIDQAIDAPVDDELKMSSYEKIDMDMAEGAATKNLIASGMENAASWLLVLPRFTTNIQPMGMGTSFKLDSHNVAKAGQAAAGTLRCFAQDQGDQGSRAAKKSGLIRQLQDRRLQANLAGREIKVLDRQIAAQRARVAICDADLRLQQQVMAQVQDTQTWMQSKYTNAQLYSWFDQTTRNLLYQTYLLTNDLANKAQASFRFERPTDKTVYLQQGGHWDSARDGLLSAESVYLGLKRLESAYMSTGSHHFEVTKHVSLRQTDPNALLDLRGKGTAQFSLPEVLFDMDFPGHYCRRIKSITVSVPCIVGPYTGVPCTLSLLRHQYRVSSEIQDPQSYMSKRGAGDEITDDRFKLDNIPISAIAISSGQQDSGQFELQFSGERFGPFEGAGVISSWSLDLPMQARQFDYLTISDVIIQIRYTSLNGGDKLKAGANKSVETYQQTLNETSGSFLVLDIKNEFSSEWYSALDTSQIDDASFAATFAIADLKERLPYWARVHPVASINAVDIRVYIAGGDAPEVKLDGKKLDLFSAATTDPTSQYHAYTFDAGATKPFSDKWKFEVETGKGNGEKIESIMMVMRYSVVGK